MRVILDESVPRRLKLWLPDHDARTVVEIGWGGVKNGRLLQLMAGCADVFITADKNLEFQQNLTAIEFGILVLPTNRWKLLQPYRDSIILAVAQTKPGKMTVI
jgi:hypothetical protein